MSQATAPSTAETRIPGYQIAPQFIDRRSPRSFTVDAIPEATRVSRENGEIIKSRSHSFDTGAAWANLALQASLPEALQHRESPNGRLPLNQIVFQNAFQPAQ